MKKQPPLMIILVTALLALLPLLAVFQYHWLGEVSKGEQERMKANLRSSAGQFARDFDHEIRNAFLHFQARITRSEELTDDEGEAALPEQYRSWQAVSPHPRLVEAVYHARADGNGSYELRKFDPSTGKLEPVDWPEEMTGLRTGFELQRKARTSAHSVIQSLMNQKRDPKVEKFSPPAVIKISHGPIDPNTPCLIINIFSPSDDPPGRGFDLPAPSAYRLVSLSRDYIKGSLIPELSQRYFSRGGQSDYKLAIVKTDDASDFIFKSEPNLTVADLGKGDVSETFFKIRINEPDRIFIAETAGGNKRVDEDKMKSESKRVAISIFQRNESYISGKAPQHGDEPGKFLAKLNDDGRWRLVVKHRAGSLEAAVAGVRRRNLAISFGILILLATSMALIVLSSRRAQKLATQQMEFVAGVSHELRTPLAVICSAAENLADGVIDNRDQIKNYGGLIRDEGRRLTGMVEQVLEFAGAQSGKQNYKFQPVRLEDVIDQAVVACHLQIAGGGFELNRRISANLPVVKVDASALSRAIQNLLNNAMKYSGESRWMEISAEVLKSEVQIKVSDRGIGIPQSEISHIFEPFYRGKEVAAEQIHGNGLGLSLVKHIIEAHGGRVSVASGVNKGAVFTLHLPLSHSAVESHTEEKNYEQTHFAR